MNFFTATRMSARTRIGVTSTSTRTIRPRRAVRCQAVEEEKKLSFESNKNAALGYTESDSAGQTNIFAVEPKTYVQGTSSDDTKGDGNSTASLAAIAGTVAAGAIFAGLKTLSSAPESVPTLAFASEYRTLSEYSSEFSAELATPAPAPALSDVQE